MVPGDVDVHTEQEERGGEPLLLFHTTHENLTQRATSLSMTHGKMV